MNSNSRFAFIREYRQRAHSCPLNLRKPDIQKTKEISKLTLVMAG